MSNLAASELPNFKLDSVIVTHSCGDESPYIDNVLQLVEWISGHICSNSGRVLSIVEFAEEVRSSTNANS